MHGGLYYKSRIGTNVGGSVIQNKSLIESIDVINFVILMRYNTQVVILYKALLHNL